MAQPSWWSSELGGAEFEREYVQEIQRSVRVFAPIMFFVNAAFLAWDWVLAPESLSTTLAIRSGMGAVCVLLFAASRTRLFTRWAQPILGLAIFAVSTGVVAILSVVPRGFELGIAGVGLVFYTAAAFRMSFRASLLAYLAVIPVANAMMIPAGVDRDTLVSNNIMLFSVSLLGAAINAVHERERRLRFAAERGLIDAKLRTEAVLEQVRAAREERITWLESLASFLRHELKNQMIGIRSSLQLLDRRRGDVPDSPYIERALRSVAVMQRLLKSATEATSIEAAVADEEWSDVELGEVAEDYLREFELAHPDRKFSAARSAEVWVHANTARIIQLLDKLLANAVEHGAAGGEIRVAVDRNGNRAVLSIENDGDALPVDTSRLFEPFYSDKPRATSAENLGIGLYVVRLIARHHGGDVSASPIAGGARFEIQLPLREEHDRASILGESSC